MRKVRKKFRNTISQQYDFFRYIINSWDDDEIREWRIVLQARKNQLPLHSLLWRPMLCR